MCNSNLNSKTSPAGKKVAVAIGSNERALVLVSDRERKNWKKIGPFLKGESVNCLRYEPRSKTLYAATHTNGVFVSKDFGKSWKQSNNGLHVKKTWTLEFDHNSPKSLYIGTHYGHLFKSNDNGASWQEVTDLFTAPKRNEWGIDWGFGTVGLCIHTIKMDQANKNRFYIVSSGGGPYRTDDTGKSWILLNNGVKETCPAEFASADVWGLGNEEPSKNLEKHLSEVHKCTHKLAVSHENPGTIYQQNHCGVYKTTNYGDTWEDISPGHDLRHGFPIALVELGVSNSNGAVFTVPAFQTGCRKHNSCIKGELAAYRTMDGGNSWKRLANGLPKNNHTCVLRDAMTTDSESPSGLYFGTTTGEVYGTTDLGDQWNLLTEDAGRVQAVSAFSL